MNREILGLHHVTAIAGDPQQNINFYGGLLGLRLVKLTVNYDDPHTYHLYYGDEEGHPGTILTFFPWPSAPRGRRGTGQATVVSFEIPKEALDFWIQRFETNRVPFEQPYERFKENVITFYDPDGLKLELVSSEGIAGEGRATESIPRRNSIIGFSSVTLTDEGYEKTSNLLTRTLGFHLTMEERNRFRYEVGSGGPGATVDLLCEPDLPRGEVLVGTVHHVAWRTPDDDQQKNWRKDLVDLGLNVTPVIDRKYFHSIYFREPGGILFEIATDPPGFTVDEKLEELGTNLKLPPWLEKSRKHLESELPALILPKVEYSTAR